MNVLEEFSKKTKRVIGYDDLAKLYDENQHKIYMTEADGIGMHKLDETGFERWKSHLTSLHNTKADSHETETYIKFAEALHAKMRYITFTEYMQRIQLISQELMPLIASNEIVFFVIAGESDTSNTWCTLLFFGELLKLGLASHRNKICVIHDAERNELMKFVTENKEKKTIAVHFDDMSYSGNQLDASLPSSINAEKQPNFSYYICISYITKFSRNRLLKKYQVLFFQNTEIVPDFEESVKDYYRDQPDVIDRIESICTRFYRGMENVKPTLFQKIIPFKRGHNAFKCYYGSGQAAVYFDHKIADYVSVLSSLFSKGDYPPNIDYDSVLQSAVRDKNIPSLHSGSLISSCNSAKTGSECYKTFYKRFNYTFNGVELGPGDVAIDEIIKIKSQAGGTRKSLKKKTKSRRKSKKRNNYRVRLS